ncbi:MAG: 16S rRNA (cytosine(1402)-N(4))-methyltransferase RsmH [Phycisphaerales bacterium]|jgi:16S rRNA (cytosine1402-N4)-methyltransferase|nr:16S rRNA (cytosine(1402)-N(4))-methyltransferase RsmH [Phycisphaerales bacterium]
MGEDGPTHVPVMLDEVVGALAPRSGEVYADCTAGLGGHAAEVARGMGDGTVVLCDLDAGNLVHAAARVRDAAPRARVETLHTSFASLPVRLSRLGLRADMVLADLGFASSQMDDPARGFSMKRDGPLDMRLHREAKMPPESGEALPPPAARTSSAADLVNSLPENELSRIIHEYGEDPAARRIAAAIVKARREAPIETTGRLAQVIRASLGVPPGRDKGPGGIDPATRTFQALRIAVNDEIGNLEALLAAIARDARRGAESREWLAPGARVAIISFHSLEDRPVKRLFKELVGEGRAERVGEEVGTPSEGEVGRNPRARSAKLRVIRVR